MVLSCCVPYGFAVETEADAPETETVDAAPDAEAVDAADEAEALADVDAVDVAETDAVEAVADVEAVDVAETDAAEAVADAEAVDVAETEDAEAVADAEAVDAPETEDAEAVADAEAVDAPEADEAEAVESDAESADFAVLNDAISGLYDFSSFNHAEDNLLKIDPDAHTVTLDFVGGDHFVVYNGLDHKVNSFIWEADVDIQPGLRVQSAALIFGFPSKEAASSNWYGANLDSTRLGGEQAFRLFGPGFETTSGGSADGIDITKTLHLKVDVHATGDFVYSFGNAGTELKTISGHISSWKGGYLGILTWESGATFSNISLEEREEVIPPPTFGKVTVTDGFQYNNNIAAADLSDLSTEGSGVWEARADGLYSNAIDKGDAFLYSAKTDANFVYSTDVKFLQERGAAALLFRNANANGHDECYAANIDAASKRCKLWRWADGMDNQLLGEVQFDGTASGNSYNLKVVAQKEWISFYVNDTLIGSTGDYQKRNGNNIVGADWGQNTYIEEGAFGLLNWDGEMVFQNTFAHSIGTAYAVLRDITVTSSTGSVEEKGQFFPTEPSYIQYVSNDASTVDITVRPESLKTVVRVYGPDGKEDPDGKNIPVEVGPNYIVVESSETIEDGVTATLTYRVNVHRRQDEAIYYNELYRDQYHYSVKDGWANDPNGLVYYYGTYHLFYQFYDDIRWGPMHWAHATSTDLVHWKDAPIAFYPDANGAMFSGCIVADEDNTSGLFDDYGVGGLVALITANGNGQRIKLAYSIDEGRHWTKVDEIAADWTDDPLYNRDFRDPKVFRWENKWFMVVAGGPLRIYSSTNLREWKCESTYANLHTECPDMYPIRADDGEIKWVLSRGGRRYKVGDFEEVNGKWTFVPDSAYRKEADNGIMNFGKDSYAAMTYYVQDFGTAANPTLPDIVELNWMNTWDDYCNQVAEKVGQAFNGTFNLNLTLGLKNVNGTYVLTQTPIEAYKDLRGAAAVTLTNAQVTENNNLLSDFSGDCYEIVATFRPGDVKRVGFDLRVGEGQKTAIRYDTESKLLSIDRSQSGIIISNMFKQVDSQTVEPNDDGSIDLHIYVDRASVEAFAKGYTVAGANQIFPSISSRGAAIVAEGGTANADVTIYPLASAWTDKVTTDTPTDIVASGESEIHVNVGDAVNLQATLLPVNVPQNIRWTVSDASVIS
ncbi:MAG: GH32 C-terminal domain-containing protein, partial [Oscillibacter sp.]|nr:GH32 C-terminal domain-containing protein [Oscillibacter sp.]